MLALLRAERRAGGPVTWENVEITTDVRALVERERRLAIAEEQLHEAVSSMRQARQALGDAVVPLVEIQAIEALANRLWTWSVLTPAVMLDPPPDPPASGDPDPLGP